MNNNTVERKKIIEDALKNQKAWLVAVDRVHGSFSGRSSGGIDRKHAALCSNIQNPYNPELLHRRISDFRFFIKSTLCYISFGCSDPRKMAVW